MLDKCYVKLWGDRLRTKKIENQYSESLHKVNLENLTGRCQNDNQMCHTLTELNMLQQDSAATWLA